MLGLCGNSAWFLGFFFLVLKMFGDSLLVLFMFLSISCTEALQYPVDPSSVTEKKKNSLLYMSHLNLLH